MTWIDTISPDDADERLAALYAAVLDPHSGRLDNIMRVHSLHPAGLEAHYRLYEAVMAGTRTLRKVDREWIALVASSINDCHY